MATDKIPEMVERVAQVLKACEYDCSQWPVENLRHLATIIFRSMREPTKKIEDAGTDLLSSTTAIDWPDPADLWRVMIDAALGE